MSEVRALIEELIERGVGPVDAAEIVARAAIYGAAERPAPKTARQLRNKRYYDKKASEKRLNKTNSDGAENTPDKETPPTPPKEINPKTPPSPLRGSSPAGFADFWALYPNKVGKRDAEKAFAKAIKRASLETIFAGLHRYVSKADDRPWCNPATWLNQDRWEDQPAQQPPPRSQSPPSERERMNAALDRYIQGKPDEPAQQTIDGSFERTDRGGAENIVQLPPASARNG